MEDMLQTIGNLIRKEKEKREREAKKIRRSVFCSRFKGGRLGKGGMWHLGSHLDVEQRKKCRYQMEQLTKRRG